MCRSFGALSYQQLSIWFSGSFWLVLFFLVLLVFSASGFLVFVSGFSVGSFRFFWFFRLLGSLRSFRASVGSFRSVWFFWFFRLLGSLRSFWAFLWVLFGSFGSFWAFRFASTSSVLRGSLYVLKCVAIISVP